MGNSCRGSLYMVQPRLVSIEQDRIETSLQDLYGLMYRAGLQSRGLLVRILSDGLIPSLQKYQTWFLFTKLNSIDADFELNDPYREGPLLPIY